MGVDEEHGVAEAAALPDHHGEPAPQAVGILDVARLDRPFDPARIGERADRIGRRQPCHQAVERGGSLGRQPPWSSRHGSWSVIVVTPAARPPPGRTAPRPASPWRRGPPAISSSTWSRRMRRRSPTICTSVWRLPRCQASRTNASGVRARDLEQRFGLSGHQHDRAVVEHDAVAVAQRHGLVEIEQELRAASPLSTMRRRCRSPASSTMKSIAVDGFQKPARRMAQPRFTVARASAHNGVRKSARRPSCRSLTPFKANIQPPARAISMRAPMSRPARSRPATPTARSRFSTNNANPASSSRLHLHTKSFQVCYVVDGSGEFQLGDEVFHAKKGACVNIPPGVPHKVGSKEGMRMLMVYSPPGLEGMMKAMKALSPDSSPTDRSPAKSWPSTTPSSWAKAPAAGAPARCWAENHLFFCRLQPPG